VLWSARAIPGNDRAIGLVVNRLVDLGVSVIPPWGAAGRGLHTSGHGLRDEVGEWLSWVRPRAVLPIHGEAWHLAEHRRALLEGRPDTEVLDLRSGGAVEFGPGKSARTVGAPTDRTFPVGVGRELWSGTERALRDRRRIARTGVVTASVEGDRVEVVAVGVFLEAECRQVEMELRAAAEAALKQDPRPDSIEDMEARVRLTLRRAVKAKTGERVECIVRGRFSRHGN
jgi:ribonuclease J